MNDRHRSDYFVFAGSVGDRTSGAGGWSAVVVERSTGFDHAVVSGGDDRAIAPAMELTAVAMGLSRVPVGASATVFTASKYVLDTVGLLELGFEGGTGWDADLWKRLANECGKRSVEWQRVHDANPSPFTARAVDLARVASTDIA
jgi:ribonuclease HI